MSVSPIVRKTLAAAAATYGAGIATCTIAVPVVLLRDAKFNRREGVGDVLLLVAHGALIGLTFGVLWPAMLVLK
jgi:hypothetical protein